MGILVFLQQPQLQIEAPPEFAQIQARLQYVDTRRLAGIMELVGLTDPGPPIQVVLETENTDVAKRTPPWIGGFALQNPEMVVVFPSRSPGYPHDTLDDVVRHEVAHILIGRASGHGAVPRWFNEGVAMAAEHGWRFEDQTQLLYQLVLGSGTRLSQLDQLFNGNERDQSRAYALAGAFVRDLLDQHGRQVPAAILGRMRDGASFDVAFADVTGSTPAATEAQFWRRQPIWTNWIPIITSSTTLWIVVTVLALVAIRSRVKRNAEIRKKWEEEDGSEDDDQ